MKKPNNFDKQLILSMKKYGMFKYSLFKHIKSISQNWITNLINIDLFSHLDEHVSNFAAVSTQVRVTLWKEDKLYRDKDKQYLLKLIRPEDR
jgi:hypothetical protein